MPNNVRGAMESKYEEEEEEYEYEEEEEDTPPSRPPPTLEIGTRVTVYWSDDDQWYKGTVTKAPKRRRAEEYVWIEYDDGDKDWMNINKQKWRQSTKPDRFIMKEPLSFIQKQEKIAKLNVGSRIVVWWPKENEYYAGTIVEIRTSGSSNKKKPHHIQYDDGDSDWEDLQYRKFKNVPPKADRLKVGSRVSVWDAQEHKYFVGTVTKLQPERIKPHRVKYDTRPREWVNLFVHEFMDIDSATTDHSNSTSQRTPIKRKREFMEPRETSSTVPCQRSEQRLQL